MRVVCLGTIGNFAALSVDPSPLKKEMCMADTLCGICKTRTATVIENKTDKLCSRCYYSRYMFRLPKSQSFVKNFTMLQIPLIITWESGIAGNRQSLGIAGNRETQAIGNPRESAIAGNRSGNAGMCRESQGIGNVGNTGIGNHRQSQGIPGNRQSWAIGNLGNS